MSETRSKLYENPETGTRQSVYDLAIGARHASQTRIQRQALTMLFGSTVTSTSRSMN